MASLLGKGVQYYRIQYCNIVIFLIFLYQKFPVDALQSLSCFRDKVFCVLKFSVQSSVSVFSKDAFKPHFMFVSLKVLLASRSFFFLKLLKTLCLPLHGSSDLFS